MNGSVKGSENCRERYGAWGARQRWQIACYYSGIFLLVFGRKYVEKWKQTLGERMGGKIIMETGHRILRETHGVL